MIRLLYGADSYRRRARLGEVISGYQKKGERVDRFWLDGEDEVERLMRSLKHVSLFDEGSVLVVENLTEAQKKFSELKSAVRDAIKFSGKEIVFVEDGKPTKEWAFLMKKPMETEAFEVLKGAEWVGFVKGLAKERQVKLSAEGLKVLAQLYEGDSWRVATFLDKVRSSSFETVGPEAVVEEGGTPAINLWAVLGEMRSPSFGTRLKILEKIFAAGEPAAKVFHLAAYRSKKELPLLARYDVAVKSGKIDYEEALVDLATR